MGTKNGPFGIFILGIMSPNGKIHQDFLDDPNDEKIMLERFLNWVEEERPILVTYSSTSADKPQLINSFKRFNLPVDSLNKAFFDLYYDCINTQKKENQYIFLPMPNSMSAKDIPQYLGYRKTDLKIRGLDALIMYSKFLKERNKEAKLKIKKKLLNYNKADLKRTKFIFDKLKELFDAHP
ncbi:MAG: ribonuclease H-like domain-containing protein [Thermoplasmata archaeon]|nr:ribonuclease H-like domain-containing protein [Thermoplasmata archaeon]